MKVGLYVPGMDKHSTSAPLKYQINLARELVKLNDIELFLVHHREVYPVDIEAKHILISERTPILWEMKLRKYNLDIIHFNVIFAARRICFPLLNCKKVVTVHGNAHWIKEVFAEYNQLNFHIKRLMERFLSRFMDRIIAVSNNLKEHLIRFLKLPESKIQVIHEGVSPIYRVIRDTNKIREKYNLSRQFILHVSNFAPKKNPVVLLRTFNEIRKNFGLRLDLVIAGARWKNQEYIRTLIEDLNLVSNVKILGYIPEEDLVGLYNAAEVFFFPTMHETFGFPVLEAMACGTPVVTSNVFSVPEVVSDAAFLCNPYNLNEFARAIRMVLDDAKLSKTMIEKGLEISKRFSWEKCATETLKVYKKL